MKTYKCIDCQLKIHPHTYLYGGKRCKSCSRKGNLNWNFKGGKEGRKCYCIDCKKELNDSAYFRGDKRCKSCTKIGKLNSFYNKHHSEISKQKISVKNTGKNLGKTNLQWIDGRSYENYPTEFNYSLRNSIRNRDNHICQNPECNMTEEEHLIVIGTNLELHHINYNRNDCKKINLITLCKRCNLNANFNRDYWYAYFTYIMEKK